jgi:thiosulfate/3-mercaptopyruvate sulfurtransferase
VTKRDDVLITAAELARALAAGEPVTVLDVRWELAAPDGRVGYQRGHVPGAAYVALEDDLTDHTVAGRGRHPLPSGRDVEAAARRWGVRDGVPVVAYDDWNRAGSSRAWWVLTAAGLTDVRILDGGLASWVASGGALETGSSAARTGDVTVAHVDPYTGARPMLTAEAAAADGDLVRLFRDHGVLTDHGATVGVYCGSGITASVTLAALAAVGIDAALFPGSWSEWSSDPNRPVAVGSE